MQIALNLVLNTTLLLSITIIFNQFFIKPQANKYWHRIAGGLILGAVGIAIVAYAIHLPNGIIFDTRSILLCVSGLFYGTVPTAIAALFVVGYRAFLGGPGMVAGIAVTLTSAATGIIWRAFRKNPEKLKRIEFYLLGLVTHIVMMLCMFLLPADKLASTISTIALPVLLIYPLGTFAMCLIIIYEQKSFRTEKLLSDSEIRFQKVIEQAPVGIAVEKDDVVTYVNSAYSRMLGMTREQIRATNWKTYTHPDDINKDHVLFQKLLKGEIDDYDLVKRYIRSNGEVVRVHLYVSILNRTDSHESCDYICIAQDITREFEREQELLASERRHRETSRFLSTLLDAIPDHIFYKDKNGVYLGCNQAFEQASGISRVRLTGRTDVELYDAETAKQFISKDEPVLHQQVESR